MALMPLTDTERTDLRRFCGYSLGGIAPSTQLECLERGPLDYRMNQLTAAELSVVRRYLGTLSALEVAIPQASQNLDTDQAAMWTHNKNEIQDRLKLFDEWRRRLCHFLGVIPGSGLSGGSVSLVI